ncbi:MAG: hypothetical protein AAF431_18930 [Pseudomonadota bacterium]
MTPTFIWITAVVLYGLFWLWYVGLGRIIKQDEIESVLAYLQSSGNPSNRLLGALRRFFEEDDGKDFVMVNLLELKEPKNESRKKLSAYQKVFLGNLLKRAGHPVFIATVASGKIENIGCDNDNWTDAGMVRYRSRRDLMEVLPDTFGSDHHALKIEALERTFAYPATPWMIFGGPKVVVPLMLALIAALTHLAIL